MCSKTIFCMFCEVNKICKNIDNVENIRSMRCVKMQEISDLRCESLNVKTSNLNSKCRKFGYAVLSLWILQDAVF